MIIKIIRMSLILILGVYLINTAQAQSIKDHPGCKFKGSASVFVEGRKKLRLGDVVACPYVSYEIIPWSFIKGQPAVRIIPNKDCIAGSSSSVFSGGKTVTRQGDVTCIRK